jgi:hypothetical protein
VSGPIYDKPVVANRSEVARSEITVNSNIIARFLLFVFTSDPHFLNVN